MKSAKYAPMKATDWFKRVPWTVVGCAVGLIAIGMTGIDRADALVGSSHYFIRQAVWTTLAIPIMLAATTVPYRLLRGWSYPLFVVNLALLTAVYFFPARHGSQRWIPLGFMDFQPSETAKLTFVLALAHYLMYGNHYRRLMGLLVPFLLTVLPVGLILREPDLGTSLIFLPVLYAMLFAAGARPRHLIAVALLGIALLPALWMGMSAEQKSRVVTVFLQRDGGPAPQGDGYHQHQSKRVLALGGVWGSAFAGQAIDDPLAYHLPAAHTDFILCQVGERWGLFGCLVTLLLYVVLIGRGLMIAAATREPFGRLLAVGVVSLIATQLIINAGMTVGLMPVTGLTLPLVSYGGSSLLSTCLAMGLLLNVGMRPGYEMTPQPFRFSRQPSAV